MSVDQRKYEQEMLSLLQEAEELASHHLVTHPTKGREVRVGWFRRETIRSLSEIEFTFNQDGESELRPLYVTDNGKLVCWEGSKRRWLRVLKHDDTPSWTLENIIYDLKRGFTLGAFY